MDDWKVISTYMKADAVADGSQVLLNEVAGAAELVHEAGFRVPVYITSGVAAYLSVPEGLEGSQDGTGRLWDVLFLAANEARRMKRVLDYAGSFTVSFLVTQDQREDVQLLIAFHPAEGFTIMLPEEY